MRLLAIESSCDETAAAVVEGLPLRVRASVVASQILSHQVHGGVVPELAARSHLEALQPVIRQAMEASELDWSDLDAVAATQGPGLSSSLLLGMGAARALAARLRRPLIPVHHMEGHLLSLFLSEEAPSVAEVCPALVLLVTGGHTALVRVTAPGDYTLLGRSIDDAAGEALDKGARLLGLPYPGGPEIEALARGGNADAVAFPLGAPDSEEAHRRGGIAAFSFSGLKTALRYHLEREPGTAPQDVAAAYQSAVMNALVTRARQALERDPDIRSLACVGGVARNHLLRHRLQTLAGEHQARFLTVPLAYCTDNAAMIGAVPLLRPLPHSPEPAAIHPNLPLLGLQLR